MANFTSNQAQMLLGILVVLAFLAQSLIPAGYMPNFKSGHVFEITICHGADQLNVLVDENLNPVTPDTKQHKTDNAAPCIFASASAKHLAFQSFIFQQVEHLTYEAYVERSTGRHFVSIINRPYFGQGPPTFLS
jgi:hypothetical protein